GNTPILDEILLAFGGAREYTWGAAGHLARVASGGNQVDLAADSASRMSAAARSDGTTTFAEATFTYDGRSYLTAATDPNAGTSVTPVYSSEGLLMALEEHTGPTLDRRHLVFYFAGRPVAQWTDTAGTENWHHYTTDHLGTPIVATDAGGAELWRSSLDPWGNDPAAGTSAGALESGVVLRLPGQWDSALWDNAVLGSGGVYYNVNRWYTHGTGRYTRTDPLGISSEINLYQYGRANPLLHIDGLGLQSARQQCISRWIAVGTGAGAAAGAIAGATTAGGACTLVAPGVGTISCGAGGAGAGAAGGGALGGTLGGLGGLIFCKDQCEDEPKPCPPCKLTDGTVVPIGQIAYRYDAPARPQHGIEGPHYNLYVANQNPKNCQCFWQSVGAVPPPPEPGWIPIQPFAP
ncbi:MAG TPA: RHS repeat-associated core domain-containing protein, partial [Thermoanaerobaculia bacterium]|nr:RHS repeat-associated core domain-containing protein [Thermoanaerobaculia bacterium]